MRSIRTRRFGAVFLGLVVLMACGSSPVFCSNPNKPEPFHWAGSLFTGEPRFPPQWTPDGGSIIFAGPSNHGGNIYIVASDASDLGRVSKTKGKLYEIDYSPDISPSGDRIVYATTRHGVSRWGRFSRNFESETSDPRGDDRQRLTDKPGNDVSPRWSPDGESIAFSKISGSSIENGIYLMDADGSNVRMLFPSISPTPHDRGWNYSPSAGLVWSPDGNALVPSHV